ncbi:uncharacterized protein LOC108736491 [Agrilus planipennis]|uniref:Uncharacterized protein LOC108736491 n=1 Tax=Agrilus planipennis TaxID=224129 RepID=A0A1W4WKK6_AGRPL|nr:uncharacterized protein LOC108736491 [Agrilus planipennis]
MLGIRSAWKDELQATAAEMVYGEPLRLPGEFLGQTTGPNTTSDFVQNLRLHVQQFRPVDGTRHGEKAPFVFKGLATASHVFVRHDGPKGPLQHPYDGPYKVVSRGEKAFVVNVRNKEVKVSINRLKPAYVIADLDDDANIDADDDRIIEFQHTPAIPDAPPKPLVPEQSQVPVAQSLPVLPQPPPPRTTRSGRRVRFPDRLQVGFP